MATKRFTDKDIKALEARGINVVVVSKKILESVHDTDYENDRSNVPRGKKNVPPGHNKFRNKKTNGFDSKKESDRYDTLGLMQKTGAITGLMCQVVFHLSVCKYIADFVYYEIKDRCWIVEDVKGFRTKEYILKKKLMLEELGIKIKEV